MQYYVIAEAELVTAFNFVGIRGSAVSGPQEAREAFRRISSGWHEGAGTVLPGAPVDGDSDIPADIARCRVLILSEEVADSLGEVLTEWQLSGRYPLVVELPPLMGRVPGRKTLVDAIRDAIGIRI